VLHLSGFMPAPFPESLLDLRALHLLAPFAGSVLANFLGLQPRRVSVLAYLQHLQLDMNSNSLTALAAPLVPGAIVGIGAGFSRCGVGAPGGAGRSSSSDF
jgi:hypothetical protein